MPQTPDQAGQWLRALGRGATDLDPEQPTGAVQDLLAFAGLAVPSCLGVSLTVHGHAQPVTFTAVLPGAQQVPVRSSMALQLPQPTPTPASVDSADLGDLSDPTGRPVLVLYAGQPAALHRPAAELLALLGLPASQLSLDNHLQLPDHHGAANVLTDSLAELSTVDHALGVLLDRGLIPSQARDALDALANAADVSLLGGAQILLSPSPPPPTCPRP